MHTRNVLNYDATPIKAWHKLLRLKMPATQPESLPSLKASTSDASCVLPQHAGGSGLKKGLGNDQQWDLHEEEKF